MQETCTILHGISSWAAPWSSFVLPLISSYGEQKVLITSERILYVGIAYVMKTREDIQEVQEFMHHTRSCCPSTLKRLPIYAEKALNRSLLLATQAGNCFNITELLNYGYHSSQAFLRFGCRSDRPNLSIFILSLCHGVYFVYEKVLTA